MSNLQIFTTKETRRESYNEVLNYLGERQQLVLDTLKSIGEETTAKELVMYLHSIGESKTTDRNFVHPRLNELVVLGLIEVTGKKVCQYTNRKVALYKCKSL